MPSGLHPIEGVFGSISLADEIVLSIRTTPGITLVTEFDFDCPPEENLCVRAAEAFLARIGKSGQGAEIRLDKQIPVFSGLGGGSADAAAVLAGLQLLHDNPLSAPELLELAARLGSDVPFCLEGGLARVRGTGVEVERVGETGPLERAGLHALVLKPPCSVSTKWAYRAFDGFPDKAGEGDLTGLLAALHRGEAQAIAEKLHNSFQPVVEAQFPAIRHAREQLEWAGALGAQLSGSGSAVYGIFPDEASCSVAAERVGNRYPKWACRLVASGVELASEEGDRA